MSSTEQQQTAGDQPKKTLNPFSKRDTFSPTTIGGYKLLTALSWVLVVVTAFVYTFHAPSEDQHNDRDRHDHDHYYPHSRTIWGQNGQNRTPFHLNAILTTIYWIVLVIFQIGYMQRLFSSNTDHVNAAANVGSHFIFNNLFTFAFLMLWTRAHLYIAELMVIVNFINLSSLYFRHSKTPAMVHIPAVSGPLALTFVALFWVGAAMVHAHSLPARLAANIFIWSFLGYGLFFLVAFRDWTMGFAMSYLTMCLAVGQMTIKVVAFQWIFAWVIAALLLAATFVFAVPGVLGSTVEQHVEAVPTIGGDRERQPLLGNN